MTADMWIGFAIVMFGVPVVVFAKQISEWEARLVTKHPTGRVTGWSGTRKGEVAWRVLGCIILCIGILVELVALVLRND